MAERRHKRNSTFKNQQLWMLLFAYQVIISNTEDDLQKAVYKLNQIIIEHGVTISVEKTTLMAMKRREPF